MFEQDEDKNCIRGYRANEVTAFFGKHYYSRSTGKGVKIHKIFNHRKYDCHSGNYHYDFSILLLQRRLKLGFINAACLPPRPRFAGDLLNGKIMSVSGWGVTSEEGETPSRELKSLKIRAISKERCEELLPGRINHKVELCALSRRGGDACQGDSGGKYDLCYMSLETILSNLLCLQR